MNYILDKGSYAKWFEAQFGEVCMSKLIFPHSFTVVRIEAPSKLSTAQEEIAHVIAVQGSVDVLPGTGFVTAKRCLKPVYSNDIPW